MRDTGIRIIGRSPWSTHFCQFYQTRQDLLDILVPFFKAGLESHELCLWITSEPLSADEAVLAMEKAVPDFSAYLQSGQIEILPFDRWYLKDGTFDSQRALNSWLEKLETALSRGWEGLRLTGNTFWLDRKDWKDFTEYEAEINRVLNNRKMLALCTYNLDRCSALEIMDVIRNHEFALIKQEGSWELIENSAYKATKEALMQTERKFSDLYFAMSEGVALHKIIYDESGKAVDYLLTDVNPAFTAITGISRETAVGQRASAVYKTGEAPYLEVYSRVAGTGESTSFETYFPPMQKYFNVSVFSPVRGQFATVFSDITERKKIEDNLKLHSIVLENTADAVFSTDMELKIQTWNKAAERIYGWTAGEVTGRPWHELLQITYQQTDRESALRELFETGQWRGEVFHYTKDGARLNVLSSRTLLKDALGNPAGIVIIARDITELKKTLEELEKQKDVLQTIMDNAHTQLAYLDYNFNFIAVNSAYCRAAKRTPEELIGKNHFALYPHPENEEIFKRVRDTGKTESYQDKPFIYPDQPEKGVTYWDWTLTPVRDNSGRVMGLVLSLVETTERKKIEEQIKLLNQSLMRRTSELENAYKELESFSYSVSHDLRAPLRSIDGFSQALLEDYSPILDEQGKDYLNRIRRSTRLMSQLIDDLLSLSHATMTEMVYGSVNLSDIARQVADVLQQENPGHPVEWNIQPGLKASGDSRLLRQVLQNLLSNAFKFTSRAPRPRIEFGMANYQNKPAYYVKDNGAGFDMKYVDQLFKPFHRLHPSSEYPGNGIGLALVQRIVARHGGRVWAEGAIGNGATFYFTLG